MADLYRGHLIELVGGTWCYRDTHRPVADDPDRPCGHCGLPNTPEGHDGCLGTLPGVKNACCGHGVEREAYVQFDSGHTVSGEEAARVQRYLRRLADKTPCRFGVVGYSYPIDGRGIREYLQIMTNTETRIIAAILDSIRSIGAVSAERLVSLGLDATDVAWGIAHLSVTGRIEAGAGLWFETEAP